MPTMQALQQEDRVSAEELREAWRILSQRERLEGFLLLPRAEAEDLFLLLSPADQAAIVMSLPEGERRSWVRLLAPDDAADLVQAAPSDSRESLLGLLDDPSREEVRGLLAYAEDRAGGLMNPRFARLRPDMTVDEALAYLRKQGREHIETIY